MIWKQDILQDLILLHNKTRKNDYINETKILFVTKWLNTLFVNASWNIWILIDIELPHEKA